VERIVKERLVGAAVLMAAAIILIPEMLSGPDRGSRAEPAAQSRNDAPIKTYTIDLSQSPSAQPAPAVVENRAPPPEESPVAPQPSVQPSTQPSTPQPPASEPLIDFQKGIQRVGGDESIYKDFLNDFVEELPGRLETLLSCYRNKDLEGLYRAAHNLKGVSANLGMSCGMSAGRTYSSTIPGPPSSHFSPPLK